MPTVSCHAFDIFYFHVVIFDPSGTYAGLKHKACFSRVYSRSPHQNSLDNPFFSPCVGHAVSFHTRFSAHSEFTSTDLFCKAQSKSEQAAGADCCRTTTQTETFTWNCEGGSREGTARCRPTSCTFFKRKEAKVPFRSPALSRPSPFLLVKACLVQMSHCPLKPRRKGTQEAEGATHKGQRK